MCGVQAHHTPPDIEVGDLWDGLSHRVRPELAIGPVKGPGDKLRETHPQPFRTPRQALMGLNPSYAGFAAS